MAWAWSSCLLVYPSTSWVCTGRKNQSVSTASLVGGAVAMGWAIARVVADSVCCVSCREGDAAGPESLLRCFPSAGPSGGCRSVGMDRAVLRSEQSMRQLLRTLHFQPARRLFFLFYSKNLDTSTQWCGSFLSDHRGLSQLGRVGKCLL